MKANEAIPSVEYQPPSTRRVRALSYARLRLSTRDCTPASLIDQFQQWFPAELIKQARIVSANDVEPQTHDALG